MAILTNTRHEAFAAMIAAGVDATQAYLDAGFSGSKKSAGENASRLRKQDKVRQRIAELIEQRGRSLAVVAKPISEVYVISWLQHIVENEQNAAARVRALELLGKQQGMFVERSERLNVHAHLRGNSAPDISRLSPAQLEQLRAIMDQAQPAQLAAPAQADVIDAEYTSSPRDEPAE